MCRLDWVKCSPYYVSCMVCGGSVEIKDAKLIIAGKDENSLHIKWKCEVC